ncbi:MAG: hypothetical protein IKD43_04100 [Clostridia bacterium]|nr:hypothetical protein [Clostridia bacterium]
MSYAHFKTYELRYSDFDFKDELKLSSLLSLTQESACLSADELGFGYADLKPNNLGFIIVNTYCEYTRPIALGDKVTVETWPLPPRHVIFERDYRLTDARGEEVAAVASRWCLVDLNSFNLLLPDKLGLSHQSCPYRAEKAVEVPAWKIPKLESAKESFRTTVKSSHCDHYLHANNARYADFFLDCFTMEELAARKVKAFQIVYAKQVKEGAELALYRKDLERGAICELRSGGELCSQFRIWFA